VDIEKKEREGKKKKGTKEDEPAPLKTFYLLTRKYLLFTEVPLPHITSIPQKRKKKVNQKNVRLCGESESSLYGLSVRSPSLSDYLRGEKKLKMTVENIPYTSQ